MKRWMLGFALFLGWATPAVLFAEEGVLNAEPDRITDEMIVEDVRTIEWLERRLAAINAAGVPAGSYHLSKATAWVAFARYEYAENDRTGIIEGVLTQAHLLARAMEQGGTGISMETPIIAGSQMIREDLWQKAAKMKAHRDFRCAEGTLAEFEVQLVRSGHEMEEMGWRHAKPYIQKAEELADLAQQQISACPQPVVVVPPPPPPAEPPVVVAIQKLEKLANEVHFALDQAEISPKTAKVLNEIISVLNAYPVISFDLKGKADHRGASEYNLALSKRRADALATYLAAGGISRNRMNVKAVGESEALPTDKSLEDFAKSRQGGFFFYDATAFEQVPQYEDLQIETPRPPPPPPAPPAPVIVPPVPPAPPKPALRPHPQLPGELEQNIILQPQGD